MFARFGTLTAALAFAFLQVALALFYWLPDPGPGAILSPTAEIFGIVAVLATVTTGRAALARRKRKSSEPDGADPADAASARERGRARDAGRESERRRSRTRGGSRVGAVERILVVTLSVVVFLFVLLGFAQGFARREFGYDLALPFHVDYVGSLFQMMYDAEPLPMFVLYCAMLAGGTILAGFLVYRSVLRLHRYAEDRRQRRVMLAATAIYAALTIPFFGMSGSLTGEAYEQIDLAVNLEEKLTETAHEMNAENTSLRQLSPLDEFEDPPSIYLFILESYGAVLFEGDSHFRDMHEFLRTQADELGEAGYHVRTRFLESPVFGGSSWMADSSLMCGLRIDNQKRYESLLSGSVECIPAVLNRAGYHTAIAAANTTHLTSRYEQVFPFDDYLFRDTFEYQGKRFGWSYMPDQFVLAFAHDHVVTQYPDTPTFVQYQLTTSHHPWNHIPPYIRDWDAIDKHGTIYEEGSGKKFRNRFVTGAQFKRGYMESIEYVLTSVFGYARLLSDDDALIIITGDHQPRKPVAKMDDNTWMVPVHVLSRDKEVAAAFDTLGYKSGLVADWDQLREEPVHFSQLFKHVFRVYRTEN